MRNDRSRYGFWRTWVAAAAVLVVAGPAPAFYWSLKPRPTVIADSDLGKPGNPPAPKADPIPLPPGGKPVPPVVPVGPGSGPGPGTGPEPNPTPEPTTGAIGLIGLATLAAVRRWKKKRS